MRTLSLSVVCCLLGFGCAQSDSTLAQVSAPERLSALTSSTYELECTPILGGIMHTRATDLVEMDTDGSFVLSASATIYLDERCSTPGAVMTGRGTFVRFGQVGEQDGWDVFAADLRFESMELTVKSEDFLALAQTARLCGLAGWELGVAQDVTGLSCTGRTNPAKGGTLHTLIGIAADGSALREGHLSAEADGLTPARRPRVLQPRDYRLVAAE